MKKNSKNLKKTIHLIYPFDIKKKNWEESFIGGVREVTSDDGNAIETRHRDVGRRVEI